MSSLNAEPATTTVSPPMPPGISNIYVYDMFNAMSWTAVLGAPMLLFLQHLNATATIVAAVACLAPLLGILQIPAARYVERVGYRRFVLSGWTARSVMIVGIVVVALLPESTDRATRIVLVLLLLFVFNTVRGISLCGLLPWFTHIVPETRRGEFLSRDQFAINVAAILSLSFYGWILSGQLAWYSFGIVFSISSLASIVSLYFLRQVPDVPVEKIIQNPQTPPWKSMIFYPPFFKFLRYLIVINMAQGISAVFWVRFFHEALHAPSSLILTSAALSTLASATTLALGVSIIDRVGNKPILTASGLMIILHFTGWTLISAGLLPFNHVVLVIQCASSGISGALWGMANIRCVMGIVPVMGRAHFLALYSVVSNVALGLTPLLCGPLLDGLAHWHLQWGPWHWNCYTLMYFGLVLMVISSLLMLRSLPEPPTMTWDTFMRELLVQSPARAVSRLLGRMRLPILP